jgi:nucleotidyltransferase/DNA polymerase involved in DNA repair
MDAFYAAVEQLDVGSAMPMLRARRLCPNASTSASSRANACWQTRRAASYRFTARRGVARPANLDFLDD